MVHNDIYNIIIKMAFAPMLAHTYNEDKHIDIVNGWWISEKYDGVRSVWNGEKMMSRNNKIYTIPGFIKSQLDSIRDPEGNPLKLDGEIWFGIDTFDIASGAARRDVNDDEVWKNMTYMVFDTPDKKLKFEDRIELISNALAKAGKIPNIKMVKHMKFNNTKTKIADELLKVENYGGEGIMLRRPKSMYVYKRSHDMLKVKSFIHKECEVVGYVTGTGRLTNLVGSLIVMSNQLGEEDLEEDENVTFKIGSGLNDWQRSSNDPKNPWDLKETQVSIDKYRRSMETDSNKNDEIYKDLIKTIKTKKGKIMIDAMHDLNKLYGSVPCIGSIVTFRYKELTKTGVPKFPTFVGVRDYE
jgi:DNA ligase-1